MKKVIKIIVVLVFAGFLAIQVYRPDRTDPPVVLAETLYSSTTVPADVQAVIARSCSDCHSNETVYPWYSNVSPFSWFLADHIEHGRSHLNFSIWNTYTAAQKSKKLEEICEQVEADLMPLPSYLWIHRDAVLSDSEAKLLCDWAKSEKAAIDAKNLN